MEASTYKAIVLSAMDYRENDKLLRLLTPNEGKITAIMKGVKKPTSKLKFGAVPFAFCEYTLYKSGAFMTVIGCSPIENFFEIAADYDKYSIGSMLLEVAEAGTGSAVSAPIFINLLKSLNMLLHSSLDPFLIAVSFLQKTIHSEGYSYAYPPPKPLCNIESVMDLLSLTNHVELSELEANGAQINSQLVITTLKKLIANFEDKFEREIKSKKLIS